MTYRVKNKLSNVLPVDMRQLPEAMTTKDCADPDRIHKHDNPMIRQFILKEYAKKVFGQKNPAEFGKLYFATLVRGLTKAGRMHRLDQEVVDWLRGLTLCGWAKRRPVREDVGHLWFPTDTAEAYEFRPGRAPAAGERPKHMRKLSLELDLLDWPARVCDTLAEIGVDVPSMVSNLRKEMDRQRFWRAVNKDRPQQPMPTQSIIVDADGEPVA
jgi:hypothetical protein